MASGKSEAWQKSPQRSLHEIRARALGVLRDACLGPAAGEYPIAGRDASIVRNFSDGQVIVLGTASELVLFTVKAPLDALPNLDPYGLTLDYGAAACTSSIFTCTGSESPILITSSDTTESIQPEETRKVFSLSFTNARTFRHDDTFPCSQLDPPDSFGYGAFRVAN